MKEVNKCCICGKEINGYGNNAEPLAHGICCDGCNSKVLAARINHPTEIISKILNELDYEEKMRVTTNLRLFEKVKENQTIFIYFLNNKLLNGGVYGKQFIRTQRDINEIQIAFNVLNDDLKTIERELKDE